jgi:hypothetical protein
VAGRVTQGKKDIRGQAPEIYMKKSKWVRRIFANALIIAGLYLIVVLNLGKSTGKWDFNIFKSDALSQFVVFTGVCLIIYAIYSIVSKKYFK